MDLIGISVAIIAIAFAALVIFLIKTLTSVRNTLDQVNQTMLEMKGQVDNLSTEATELIRSTNEITADIKNKTQKLDGIFHSIEDLGVASQQMTASIKQVSTTISSRVKQMTEVPPQGKTDKLSEMFKYVTAGVKLWQSWQERKAQKEEQVHTQEASVSDHIKM
ncbi:DUF948 domain-containing protein [Bacillus horti]|uniref:Uncharacterized protein YoxC n=1 Tax=Caldalkalibacillus horti TaxID=77523 RepID=A0ABT9W0H8_9BACI|nr:DUF948 domain-containing protein [Bacillus horti]MDQ0166768.1 uncharacterized protein YoxC [Bacillus horti]